TVAFMICVFIVMSVMDVWTAQVSGINRFILKRGINRKSLAVGQMLVRKPGMPTDWEKTDTVNSSTVDLIGFSKGGNLLDRSKLDKASSITYEQLRQLIGLSKEDAYITVRDITDPTSPVLYEYGMDSNATSVVISRYGVLDDSIMEVKVKLYYKSGSHLNA
ncbi:hypothetical protein ACFLRF_06250, partial [Candidatus Altiarchaeota archaeon]